MSTMPPRFEPLRRASPGARVAAYLVGPLLWVAALSVLGLVVSGTEAVAFGLLIAAASFGISVPVLLLVRRRRVREERAAQPAHGG